MTSITKKQNLVKIKNYDDDLQQSYCSYLSQKKKQVQKSQASSDNQSNPDQPNIEYLISPYVDQYRQNLKEIHLNQVLQRFNQNHTQTQILYNNSIKNQFKFNFQSAYKTNTLKIISFNSKISFFSIKLKLLNLTSKDQLKIKTNHLINQGAYGSVFQFKINSKNIALKSIPLKKPFFSTLNHAFQQLMILKISSFLKCAPQFSDLYGFDMITTDDSILFGCQKGVNVYQFIERFCKSQQELDLKFEKLKQKLSILHKLSITHNDIKPDNIIYSPSLNQFVFIDFGLSEVNAQQIGFMKMESAKGSLNYCCNEMRNLLTSEGKLGHVDMYFNDWYGLKKTINQLKQHYRRKLSDNFYLMKQWMENIKENNRKQYSQQNYQINNDFDSSSSFFNEVSYQEMNLNHIKMNEYFYTQDNDPNIDGQLIQFLSLVYEMDFSMLKKLFIDRQDGSRLVYNNFGKVYFIFFQIEMSFQLFNIYSNIVERFKNMKSPKNYETQQIINKLLQPYFRCFTKEVAKNNEVFLRYLERNTQQYQAIRLRFFKPNLFQLQKESKSETQLICAQDEILSLQIDPQGPISQKIIQKLLKHITNNLTSKALMGLFDLIITQFNTDLKWYNIPYEKVKTFENLLQRLKINIIFKQTQITIYFQKFFVYLRLFANIFLQLLRNFDIISFIQCYLPPHQKDDLSYLQFKIKSDSIQMNKSVFNRLFLQPGIIISAFYHKILITLRFFCSLMFQDGTLNEQIKFDQKILEILDQKICDASIYRHLLKGQKQSMNFSTKQKQLEQFCCFVIQKSLEIRDLILKQTFCRLEQFSYLMGMVRFRDRFIKYGNMMSLLDQKIKCQSLKDKLLSQIRLLNLKIHKQNLMDIQLEEQIYTILIYKIFLPFSMFEDYGLIKRMENLVLKIESVKTNCKFYETIKCHILCTILSYQIQVNNVQKAIDIIEKIDVLKDRVTQEIFYSICLDFFYRINNTKLFTHYSEKAIDLSASDVLLHKQNLIADDKISYNKQISYRKESNQKINRKLVNQMNKYIKQVSVNKNKNLIINQSIPLGDVSIDQKQRKYNREWQKMCLNDSRMQKTKFRLVNKVKFIQQMIKQLKQDQIWIIKKYLKKFQVEQNKVIQQIHNNFQQIIHYPIFIHDIKQLIISKNHTNFLNQENFIQIVSKQIIFMTKSKLIQTLIGIHSQTDKNILQLIQYQWLRFHKFVNKNYLQSQIPVPKKYLLIKSKFYQILLDSSLDTYIISTNFTNKYLKSSLKYFGKIRYLTFQNKNMLSLTGHKENTKINFIDLQVYIHFLLNLYTDKITLPKKFRLFYTKKVLRKLNNDTKELIQNQLIEVFLKQFFHQIGKIFTFAKTFIWFLWFLIQVGCRSIFQPQCNDRNSKSYQSSKRNEILIFMILSIVKFIHKNTCTRYTSFMLKFFQQIKGRFIVETISNLQNLGIFQTIQKIDNFMQRINRESQQKAQNLRLNQVHILVINCLKVKFNLFKHYFTDINFSSKSQKDTHILRQFMRNIKKSIAQLILVVDDLQFLTKQYIKNQVLKLLVSINKLKKIIKIDDLSEGNHITNLSTKRLNRIEISYFRTCRRIRPKSNSQINILNLSDKKFQYDSFSYLDHEVIKNHIEIKNKPKEKQQKSHERLEHLRQNIQKIHLKKIRNFLINIE